VAFALACCGTPPSVIPVGYGYLRLETPRSSADGTGNWACPALRAMTAVPRRMVFAALPFWIGLGGIGSSCGAPWLRRGDSTCMRARQPMRPAWVLGLGNPRLGTPRLGTPRLGKPRLRKSRLQDFDLDIRVPLSGKIQSSAAVLGKSGMVCRRGRIVVDSAGRRPHHHGKSNRGLLCHLLPPPLRASCICTSIPPIRCSRAR